MASEISIFFCPKNFIEKWFTKCKLNDTLENLFVENLSSTSLVDFYILGTLAIWVTLYD